MSSIVTLIGPGRFKAVTPESSPESSQGAQGALRAQQRLDRAALVHRAVAAPHLASGALVRMLEDWCPPFPGFFLYYPSRCQQPAAVSALIQTLRL